MKQTQATQQERDARFAKTRAALQSAELDALLVAGKGHWWTGRGYFRYFSDFHLWGHDGLLLLPVESDPVLTLTSPAVASRIGAHGWVTDTRGDVYIVPEMVAAIRDKGLAKSRIGIAGMRFILSAGSYAELQAQLPDVTWLDADALIDGIRAVKSPLEQQQNRELWQVAKTAMEHFVQLVPDAQGMPQRALAAEVTKQIWAAGARDILIFMGETANASDPPSDAPMRCTDKVRFHLEICGSSGHWCEITANCAFTPPSELEIKLMEDELAAFAAVREVAKPGAKLSDMARVFNDQLLQKGWQLGEPTTHFHFHGQGMDTIERPWFAQAEPWGQSQDWTLEAGMVFSYHPRRKVLPAGQWTTGINEDIVITDQGAERFSGGWDHRWRQLG
jgi:Xaa-Pro dipeptidase